MRKRIQIRVQAENHTPSGLGRNSIPMALPSSRASVAARRKGLEYLFHEVTVIESQLLRLNLGLDDHMRQALVSFIHSVGWESFLYSRIIDCLEVEDFSGATEEIGRWIFDQDHKVIGGLLDRRREEMNLFLQEVDANPWASTEILLTAFRNYTAAPHEVRAIRTLEESISPYILSEFANDFRIDENPWSDFETDGVDLISSGYD
jgi:GH24 family phage-related lysozyme (muramidase)